jgi:hypothetical protein
MSYGVYRETAEWAGALDRAGESDAVTVVLIQASPCWLTDSRRQVRAQVETAVGRLLFAPGAVRLARVLLYDPPSAYVSEFVSEAQNDASQHAAMTKTLRDWLRIVDMWGALFTTKRHLARRRPENERYQVKTWVIAELDSAQTAQREANAIPRDVLLLDRGEMQIGELYRKASESVEWSDERLLWRNAGADLLDPTVGRGERELLAAGTARFFSVDVTAERWWGGEQ